MTTLIGAERIVFFFCDDLTKDPVAPHVWSAVTRLFGQQPAGFDFDGRPVLVVRSTGGAEVHLARTREVLSHDYRRFLPEMVERFGGFEFAGLVNWHAGSNAPDRVLTVHSTGDPLSGVFGRADPGRMRKVLRALERNRAALALDTFSVVLEGTHWSGIVYGGEARSIREFDVPLIDVEIGSSPSAWSDGLAAEVVARSLIDAFAPDTGPTPRSLLCVGGIHVEPAFRVAVFGSEPGQPLAVSHILPNQWLVGYDTDEGLDRLRGCVGSIDGGIDAIVFHDNLRGGVKARLRELGEELGVPTFKHQRLRSPAELALPPRRAADSA